MTWPRARRSSSTMHGILHRRRARRSPSLRPCIFEHVYFARPDSLMDGSPSTRRGCARARRWRKKIRRLRPELDIDVVIPIPDTSRIAAQSMAYELGIKFREGLMKNRYIGRTFIMPGQNQRKKSVRQKLNPVPLEFSGKNVMLVDDSIVRGTTCRQIIEMAREAGCSQCVFRVGRATGALSQCVRHRYALGLRADCPQSQRSRRSAN